MDISKYALRNNVITVTVPPKGAMRGYNYEVHPFPKSPEVFSKRTTIFYGASGTGKSTLIKDSMFQVRKEFPKVIIFCPTASINNDYKNIVPDALVYEEFNIEDIARIMEVQMAAVDRYNIANDIELMEAVYAKIKTTPDSLPKDAVARKAALKRGIMANREQLKKKKLTKDETIVVQYINFNPKVLVIFDDCGTEIKELRKAAKKNKEYGDLFGNFFFKGRHFEISSHYAFQDDTQTDADIRKNSFYSSFTTSAAATVFFSRPSSGMSPQIKHLANYVIDEVFKDNPDGSKSFRTLMFDRMASKFYYWKADIHGKFEMCDPAIRDYCKRIAAKKTMVTSAADKLF